MSELFKQAKVKALGIFSEYELQLKNFSSEMCQIVIKNNQNSDTHSLLLRAMNQNNWDFVKIEFCGYKAWVRERIENPMYANEVYTIEEFEYCLNYFVKLRILEANK